MTQQRKNFGLAAQLTQPRQGTTAPEAETTAPVKERPAVAPPAAEVEAADLHQGTRDSTKRFNHTDHTKRRSVREKKPGAPPREGGYVRRTITLGPGLSDYVDRAWRTYRKPNGKYVKGVSGFIEAIIDEHRRRSG